MVASFLLISCNEPRNNASSLNKDQNEAAEASNADKFQGKKQQDAVFVYGSVASNYGEIKLAELAIQRSRTTEVKQIAAKLLTDHTASLNELKMLAQSKAISVPVEETDVAKRKLESIAVETGETFDLDWCNEMLDLHRTNIDKFEKRLAETEDPDLRVFIEKTLAVLRHHRQTLEASNERLKGKSS